MTTSLPNDEERRARLRTILPLAALAVVVALRLLTLARDTWEWDELLFVAAARDGFDVRVNHPQPPGYPLFVLPARLLVLLGAPPFDAVLGIAVLGGLAAVLLLVCLARDVGAGREESLWAGLLWACVPAVWLHSARPLSDGLGAAAFFLAALLLVRSARAPDRNGLFVAALAVGAVAAIRPQLAVALLPLALVAAFRVVRAPFGAERTIRAGLAGLAAAFLPYVPVLAGSGGVDGYSAAARIGLDYVRRFEAPPLSALATAAVWERWLVDPFGGPVAATAVWLAAAGVLVSVRASRLVAVTFVPLLAFSAAALNPATAPRYGIAVLAAAPVAASIGLTRLAARHRWLAGAIATLLLAVVALPAARPLAEVASRPSPPVAAMKVLCDEAGLRGRPVLLAPALRVHWSELGPAVPWRELEGGRPVPAQAGALVVTNDTALPGFRPLRVFRYESEALRRISRGRFLSVSIQEPVGKTVTRETFKATDDALLSSVDEPAEGAVVRAPVKVRGWCQEKGGGLVAPVEFRVDGKVVPPERLVRTARPDVAAAIPEVGDASRAGYEAILPAGATPPGEHVLEVVFETRDRRRVYPPRRFTVAAGRPATRGS